MMYPQKRPLKTQKIISKPVNIANLINQKILERQKNNENPSKNPNPNPFLKKPALTFHSGTLSLTIQNKQKNTSSLRQYVQILEQKQKRHESQILYFKRKINECEVKDQFDNVLKQSYYYGLEEYYVKSRKMMVDICYELVDCKGVLMSYSQSVKFKSRIQNITGLLTKIQIFMKSNSLDVNNTSSQKQEQKSSIKQLKSIIQIQQKSIKHLKQMSKYPIQQSFEQQKRLLRYEINRLFLQNQKLKQNCGQTYSQFLVRLRSKDFQNERVLMNQTIRQYFDLMNNQLKMKDIQYRHKVEKEFIQNRLEEQKQVLKQLETEYEGAKKQSVKNNGQKRLLEEEIKIVSDQNLTFKIELRKLVDTEKQLQQQIFKLNSQNTKLTFQINRLSEQNRSLKNQLSNLNSASTNKLNINSNSPQHQKSVRQTELEDELNQLKQKLLVTEVLLEQSNSRLRYSKQQPQQQQENINSHSIKNSNQNVHSIKSFEHTLEQKILFLQEYLRQNSQDYYLIFRQFKRKQQQKVNENKLLLQKQNEQKEMVMGWCKKIYVLLKQSDIPQNVIQQHLLQLQELNKSNKKNRGPKINRLLESVKQCSNKLDKHQQREIEEELEEYIVTLNKRADVIQQVSNEDGSSVAASLTDFRSEAFTDFDDRQNDLND